MQRIRQKRSSALKEWLKSQEGSFGWERSVKFLIARKIHNFWLGYPSSASIVSKFRPPSTKAVWNEGSALLRAATCTRATAWKRAGVTTLSTALITNRPELFAAPVVRACPQKSSGSTWRAAAQKCAPIPGVTLTQMATPVGKAPVPAKEVLMALRPLAYVT